MREIPPIPTRIYSWSSLRNWLASVGILFSADYMLRKAWRNTGVPWHGSDLKRSPGIFTDMQIDEFIRRVKGVNYVRWITQKIEDEEGGRARIGRVVAPTEIHVPILGSTSYVALQYGASAWGCIKGNTARRGERVVRDVDTGRVLFANTKFLASKWDLSEIPAVRMYRYTGFTTRFWGPFYDKPRIKVHSSWAYRMYALYSLSEEDKWAVVEAPGVMFKVKSETTPAVFTYWDVRMDVIYRWAVKHFDHLHFTTLVNRYPVKQVTCEREDQEIPHPPISNEVELEPFGGEEKGLPPHWA